MNGLSIFVLCLFTQSQSPARERLDSPTADADFAFKLIDERESKYNLRFDGIDKALERINLMIAEDRETFARRVEIQNTMVAMKEAVDKAEKAAEERFKSVNEFRSTLSDQQNTLMRKTEADIRFDSLEKKIDVANDFIKINAGRTQGINAVWVIASGVIGLLLTPIITVWRDRRRND